MESSLDRRRNQHLLETSLWENDKEKDKTKNKDCWTKHPLLETSFWDSDHDSEPEEFKALGPEKTKEETGIKAVFKDFYEEEVEEENSDDSDDEGIGSMDSACQSEVLDSCSSCKLPGSPGERSTRAFDRGRRRRRLGRSMGDLLNQFKQSLQSRGRTEVFNLPLTDLLDKEGGTVPKIVLWATSLIESRGPEAWEGIYRLSGQATTVTSLKNAIMSGRKPRSSDSESIHSVAAVLKVRVTKFIVIINVKTVHSFYCAPIANFDECLKNHNCETFQLFFRELPNPVCTHGLHEQLLSCVRLGSDKEKRTEVQVLSLSEGLLSCATPFLSIHLQEKSSSLILTNHQRTHQKLYIINLTRSESEKRNNFAHFLFLLQIFYFRSLTCSPTYLRAT